VASIFALGLFAVSAIVGLSGKSGIWQEIHRREISRRLPGYYFEIELSH
jgi:hypothetical protein